MTFTIGEVIIIILLFIILAYVTDRKEPTKFVEKEKENIR